MTVNIINPTPCTRDETRQVMGWGHNIGLSSSFALVVDSPYADIDFLSKRLTTRHSKWSYWGYGEFVFSEEGEGWYVNSKLELWELGLDKTPVTFDVWSVDGWYPLPFGSENWRVIMKSTQYNKERGWARRRVKGYRTTNSPQWYTQLVLEAEWGGSASPT